MKHKENGLALSVSHLLDRFPFLSLRDIFPRPGEVFLMEGGFDSPAGFPFLPKAPSLRELAHEVRLKELSHIFPAKRIKSA